MTFYEWIEQPLRITDSLAIDEPINIKMCYKYEMVLKAENISPSWRGNRHFVCLPNIHTFSSALSLFENKTIAKQLFSLFIIVILCQLSPYDIYIHICQWHESFALGPYLLYLGLQNTIPESENYKYIYISISTSL